MFSSFFTSCILEQISYFSILINAFKHPSKATCQSSFDEYNLNTSPSSSTSTSHTATFLVFFSMDFGIQSL